MNRSVKPLAIAAAKEIQQGYNPILVQSIMPEVIGLVMSYDIHDPLDQKEKPSNTAIEHRNGISEKETEAIYQKLSNVVDLYHGTWFVKAKLYCLFDDSVDCREVSGVYTGTIGHGSDGINDKIGEALSELNALKYSHTSITIEAVPDGFTEPEEPAIKQLTQEQEIGILMAANSFA